MLVAICVFLLVVFYLYFNRRPTLRFKMNAQVIKPCHGTLKAIEVDSKYIHLYWFLNLHDIHSQYVPVTGKVISIKRRGSTTYRAYKLERTHTNRRVVTTIETPNRAKVIVEQVAGAITALIRNNLTENQIVKKGDDLGYILLGSQVIMRLPRTHFRLDKIEEHIGERSKPGKTLYS